MSRPVQFFAGLAGFAFLAGAPFVFAAAQPPERVSLAVLLDRARWYLDDFVDEFENVVAEETYIQDSAMLLPSFSPVAGGRAGVFASPPDSGRARHRELRSDFLLAKSPATDALVPFRDVIEVDGVPVRDREARLAKLFLTSPSNLMEQVEKISVEGARYNLGNMRSTLGNPVLALGVLQHSYQLRFRFSLAKNDRSLGAGVSVVEYREVTTPAMIRGEAGLDLMAHGRIWIHQATGRVLKTELQVEQPAIRAVVTTTFRVEERTGIAVPLEMRSAASEIGRNEDEVLHDVEITRPFLIGQFEVTQQQWRTVMGTSPSHFGTCGARCPVENVTFLDVQQFLTRMNAHVAPPQSKAPSLRFRLPTEGEWEYACRARTTGPFVTGENLTTAQANYNGRQPYRSFSAGDFRQKPTAVGTFPLNPWGLGDMHGNVWEWTADWYGPYAETGSANIDPQGPPSGERRVIRGGSWFFDANSARCGLRYTHAPQDKGFSLGFRVAADRMR